MIGLDRWGKKDRNWEEQVCSMIQGSDQGQKELQLDVTEIVIKDSGNKAAFSILNQ